MIVSTLAPTADQELLFIVNGELEFLKTISEGIHYFQEAINEEHCSITVAGTVIYYRTRQVLART
jgi:hypothetical protein